MIYDVEYIIYNFFSYTVNRNDNGTKCY